MKYNRETTFTDIVFCYFSSFIFKENYFSIEENDSSEKVVIKIQNLEDLPRLVFYEECGKRRLVIDDGEFTRNIN